MTTVTRPGVAIAPAPSPLLARLAVLLRGTDAAWVRPAHIGVTLLAAVFYLANLTVSGFANTYYSAAALAGSQSWTAWLFGSVDAANFITVDKPPLATMLMGLSVRLFGLSSWSILLPEALCGIATVALLFAIVRRSFGPVAATIGGVVMAVMPVAVLIFRYDNPDALLTLLLVLAAGALLRGLEHGRIRWAVLAAVFVGLAFNTKLLQAYLVLPVFAFVWAVAAPGGIRRRIAGLGAALVAVVVSSAWWVAAVELTSAGSRPFIGGSTSNSALDLVLGYDGLGRIFGMTGPGGGGAGGFSGTPGILRLFNAELGGQIAWLLPFALIALVAGIAMRGRLPRTDSRRAAYLLWGGWLIVTGLVFSFMSGVIHSYYAVALVPAVAALVGAGVVDMWALRQRSRLGGVPLAAAILSSAAVACVLLERTSDFVPGLGIAVFATGMISAVVIALPTEVGTRVRMAAVAIAMVALLAGPVAYSTYTVATAHAGGDPSAGPQVASSGGRGGFGSAAGGPGAQAMTGTPPSGGQGGTPPVRPGRGTGRHGRRRRRRRRWGRGRDARCVSPRQPRIGDVDRGGGLCEHGGPDRARHRRPGHGDGRLHRLRPGPHPGPAEGVRHLGPAPLRDRRWPGRRGRRRPRRGGRDLDRDRIRRHSHHPGRLGHEHMQARRLRVRGGELLALRLRRRGQRRRLTWGPSAPGPRGSGAARPLPHR